MCAICGIFEPKRTASMDCQDVKAMADTMCHRGPDEEGFYAGPGIALGHRRLSIIDLASGQQPLSNEDGTIWVVFNGEIYNFQELNDTYLKEGHHFKTRSDTETIVHLYEELGDRCFEQMRGMFAIALWDGRRRRLVLARDRVGKKPLFYYWDGKRFLFASEMKAFWVLPNLSRELDLEALCDYFSLLYVPAPKTIFRQARKLRPAHYMVVDESGIREVPYWDLHFGDTRDLPEAEWCARLMEEYRNAVRLRLVSDVPLGAFLSGGADSSSVVALMNEYQPPVTTCSIGFTEQSYNEADDARTFAQSLGANHHEETVKPQALEILERLVWHYDEPFADSSAVPTYYVSKVARQHVTVALSGDGGDENFAGYRRYKLDLWENRLRSYVPQPLRKSVFGPLGRWYPKLGWAPRVFRAKATLQSLARSPLEGYFHAMSSCPPEYKRQLLGADVWRQLNGYDSIEVLRQYYDRADTTDPLSRIQYVDIKTYLVDDILVKVDRASMANSLEVRSPLLDHRLMELVAQMPSSLKLRNGQGKYIFKKALRRVLPARILTRRKQGFAVPVAEWFRGELKDFSAQILFARQDELLNRKFVERCWREHQRGWRDWSPLLWSILMFRTWQEVYKTS